MGTAAKRLSQIGFKGLRISGFSKAAGMSHATVIHHFGSAGAMKKALLQEMTGALLADVIFALKDDISADEFLSRSLVTLSRDGHGSLLARLGLEIRKSMRFQQKTTRQNCLKVLSKSFLTLKNLKPTQSYRFCWWQLPQ